MPYPVIDPEALARLLSKPKRDLADLGSPEYRDRRAREALCARGIQPRGDRRTVEEPLSYESQRITSCPVAGTAVLKTLELTNIRGHGPIRP